MSLRDSLIIEGVRLLTAGILLVVTWGFGQRILAGWEGRKKRHELDLATNNEFYDLYGAFKDIAKQWRIVVRSGEGLALPENIQWGLLSRACAVESRNEAIIMKLAAERLFSPEQLRTLGLFRQAFQQLREAIRDNKEVPSSSRGTEYLLFNALAAEVASILATKHTMRRISRVEAVTNLEAIAKVNRRDLSEAISGFQSQNTSAIEDE